jgi:hypothetical protein
METYKTLFKVSLLIPITSNGKEWKKFEDTFLYTIMLPSFINTKSPFHTYTFYLGIDEDDLLFTDKNILDNMKSCFESNNIKLKLFFTPISWKGHLTKIWNILFKNAFDDGNDYFYQCGDDINFLTYDWVNMSIDALIKNNDIGVTGPDDIYNSEILTQNMVSRRHMEIFNYLFPEEILNWYCDTWINDIYKHTNNYISIDARCSNSGGQSRYKIVSQYYSDNLFKESLEKILQYSKVIIPEK